MNIKSIGLGFLLGFTFAGALILALVGSGRDKSVKPVELGVTRVAPESDARSEGDAASRTNATDGAPAIDSRFKVRTLADAARKRFEGEYILDSEIEQLMTKLGDAAERGSELMANTEWERYAKLLTVLGMSSADQTLMQRHYRKIVKAKLVAGQMATSLANAQSAYESGMRRLLGENFDLYRAYESEGLGRYEVRLFAESLDTSSSGVAPNYNADQIFDLFSKYEVYSPKALGFTGLPFQPNPTLRTGVFATEALKESMTSYVAKAKALAGDADFQQLAPELQQAIKTYLEATADQLNMDYRASMDPEFAHAMWKRNQSHSEGKHHRVRLKSGQGYSSETGVIIHAKEDDGG